MKRLLTLALTGAFAAMAAFVIPSCSDPAPENTLVSIAVTTPPAKMAYDIGETFDPAGMVVTATYSDESTAPATLTAENYTYDFSTAGTGKSVTITWEGKTTALTGVTVNAAPQATERYKTVPFVPEPATRGSSTPRARISSFATAGFRRATPCLA